MLGDRAVAKRSTARLPALVGLDPARVCASPRAAPSAGTASRRSSVDRPGADEGLVDEQLLGPVGRAPSRRPGVQLAPAQRRARAHSLGDAGERAEARPHVGAALRVVRRAREQRVREALGALERSRAWNVLDGEREPARIAADLVQREQADVAVEGRVLDALRHHRAASSAGTAVTNSSWPALLEQERPAAARSGSPRATAARSALLDPPAPGLDVGAVDQRATASACGRSGSVEQPRAAARPRARTSSAACSSFASRATSANGRRSPVSCGEPVGLRRRVDEQRLHVVQRTRSRSCPRPASRAAARRARGSSRPRPARRRRRAAARGSRADRRARRGGRSRRPSTSPSRTRLEHQAVRRSRRPRDPRRGRRRARRRRRSGGGRPVASSRSKKRRAQLRVAPERVLVLVAAMWFGTTSRTTPSPAAQSARSVAPRRRARRETRVGSTTS